MILNTRPAGLRTAPDADIPGFSRPTDEDLARWVNLAENIREEPRILQVLARDHPDAYEEVVVGLRRLAIVARSEEWRSPAEGVGGRAEQLIPGTPGSFSDRTDWLTWLLMGGRGSGKSRTGAEATRELLLERRWRYEAPVWGLVGQTLDTVRVVMVENTLLPCLPPGALRRWNRNNCELYLTNGAFLKGFSSEVPDKIRGWNLHGSWADELSSWADADKATAEDSTWSNLKLATRAHDGHTWMPRIIATTTPKPKRILRNPDPADPAHPGLGIHDDPTTVVTSMSTLANLANLPAHYIATVVDPLVGTRLYDQEVLGQLVDEVLGAQWSYELVKQMERPALFHETRAGGLQRIVIGVDPSVGSGHGAECGIVVVGLAQDGRAYILEDCSKRCRPEEWVRIVSAAFQRWSASAVVVEVNHGADLVAETIGRYAPNLPIVEVRGKVGKMLRAEPVAVLSVNDRVRFSGPPGAFSELQRQMRTWDGSGDSPDRLDAMVYGVLYLLPPGGIEELISIRRPGAYRSS